MDSQSWLISASSSFKNPGFRTAALAALMCSERITSTVSLNVGVAACIGDMLKEIPGAADVGEDFPGLVKGD